MKRIAILALTLTTLTGCVSMPVTRLVDGKGHTIVCGGETSSVLPVAYVIDKGVDLSCVARAKAKGYVEQK